jgi:hypothetical protein
VGGGELELCEEDQGRRGALLVPVFGIQLITADPIGDNDSPFNNLQRSYLWL